MEGKALIKKAFRKKDTYNPSITPPASSEVTSDKHQLKSSEKFQASMMTDLKPSRDEVDSLITACN